MEKMSRQVGVTLLELMIVLGIIAILAAIAAPDMGVTTQQRRIASTATTLQDALASARTQAVMRSAVVSIQGVNGDWLNGVQSFVPNNGQGGQVLAANDTRLETFIINNPSGITITAGEDALEVLSFNNLGGLEAGGSVTLAVCSNDSRVTEGINLQINAAGRVKQGVQQCP